ncbi:MAG: hypothetical protein CVV03_01395 [Firmicutes bacterium HGW-Firmicutes-8]|nr:MAG: hypothetical protein CVV03_01395 [Firmicutes bacterium HGW-Firmicutes-8]
MNYAVPDDLQGLMNYHGHLCFGVLLGYKACKYAEEIIGRSDNMMVLIENGACDRDAVKFLLDCTIENGKLINRQGKTQSWSVYNKDEGEGVRLTVNPNLANQLPKDKDQAMGFIMEMPGNLLFNVEPFNCGCH